jgi:hypothetical protein|nr:MAG TPA: hypothetical protein [Caudoviricetes sp.]
MSDKFGKFGKFNKLGEFSDGAKEVVTEDAKVEETPTTFGKVRVDETTTEVKEEIREGGKFMEDKAYTPPVTEAKTEVGFNQEKKEPEVKTKASEPKMFETVRETKAAVKENIERANAHQNNNKLGGIRRMEGRKADIIALRVNVRLGDLAAFLQGEIKTPFDINLKEFSPERELQTVDENDRKNMESIVKKIVAYGEDSSYLNTVPVITVDTKYLKAPIDDINLIAIGINQEKPSLQNFNNKYCVPHIVDRAGGQSDVFLDTATVVTLTACELLNNCINKDDILNRNSQYAVAISFNRRDGYTVEFVNKNYREVR